MKSRTSDNMDSSHRNNGKPKESDTKRILYYAIYIYSIHVKLRNTQN